MTDSRRPRSGGLIVRLCVFAVIAWWGYFSERGALGLVLSRDLVSYLVGGLAFVLGAIVARRLPLRGAISTLGLFCFYTIAQFAARDDYGKVKVQSLIEIVFPIAFFSIGHFLWKQGRYATPLKAFVVAMAISAAIGLLNFFTGFAQPLFILNQLDRTAVGETVLQRGGSLAGVSIETGLLVAIGTLLAAGLPRGYRLAIPIFVLSLISTLSRGGIFAIAAGLAVLSWFSLPPPGPRRRRTLRLAGAVAIGTLVLALVAGSLAGRSSGVGVLLARFGSETVSTQEHGNWARINSWERDLDVWSASPVFGSGLGVLGTIGATDAQAHGRNGLSAESWYLQILGELGLPGFVLYLLTLVGVFTAGWRAIGRGEPGRRRGLGVASMGGLAILAFDGVFLQNLNYFVGSLFWYFAGGLLAYDEEETASRAMRSRVSAVLPAAPPF